MNDDPLIGRVLGNYRIERYLGRGASSRVYYGWDVTLERPVALKIVTLDDLPDQEAAERFIKEAQTVANWHHDNVIQIYTAGTEDDLYYFAMQHIDGTHVGELLARTAARDQLMPTEEVLRIGRAVADALDYAHEQGVIHRDVKPANVLVEPEGRIVLSDFGVAHALDAENATNTAGSPPYMSPEHSRKGAAVVAQSDVYSFGVMLYEMMTGSLPFDDPSPTSLALQHISQEPPKPRDRNPDLNRDTEAVLLKALAKSPDKRYTTAGALIDALADALTFGPEAPPVEESPPPEDGTDRLIGRTFGEYNVEELIGRGGMARVYKATDPRLDRVVALKVIDVPFQSDADYTERFEREARAIAKLEHPHIVRLYRYDEAEGMLYMAAQYIGGGSLRDRLAAEESIEPEFILRIVEHIGQALDYAHAQGVIHRDVKPSNILLDDDSSALLTDFGLALLTDIGTRGEILGSPYYIAPEQAISSAQAVPQSDLYALGVIVFEMLTGRRPFTDDDPVAIVAKHMTEDAPSPRTFNPEIAADVEQVILTMLAKEPDQRYPTGAAFAEALADAFNPETTPQAPPVAPPEPPPPEEEPAEQVEESSSTTAEPTKRSVGPLPPIPAVVAPPDAAPAPPTPQLLVGVQPAITAEPVATPARDPFDMRWLLLGCGVIGVVGYGMVMLAIGVLIALTVWGV